MSSILDALRKVEREKAEVAQTVDADFDEAAAERDLIGGTDGRGHMVLHLPPWMLMAFGGAFVLAVVATAGLAWLYLREPAAASPVAIVTTATLPVATPAPKPEPPKPPVVESVPAAKEPEREAVVAKAPAPEPVIDPIKPEPAKPEPVRVEEPAVEPPKEVSAKKPVEETKTIAKAVEEREEAQPEEEAKPAEEPKAEEPKKEEPKETPEPETEPAPEPLQVAKAEEMPAPLPEMKEPPVVVQPTIGEPLKSAPRPPEPIEAAVPDKRDEANEGAVLPPTEEDRRLIKLNMPRPANKRNPYASAIINLQPVFLNEMIPNTNAKLISVEEKGVIILKQDTGTRHFIPF